MNNLPNVNNTQQAGQTDGKLKVPPVGQQVSQAR